MKSSLPTKQTIGGTHQKNWKERMLIPVELWKYPKETERSEAGASRKGKTGVLYSFFLLSTLCYPFEFSQSPEGRLVEMVRNGNWANWQVKSVMPLVAFYSPSPSFICPPETVWNLCPFYCLQRQRKTIILFVLTSDRTMLSFFYNCNLIVCIVNLLYI